MVRLASKADLVRGGRHGHVASSTPPPRPGIPTLPPRGSRDTTSCLPANRHGRARASLQPTARGGRSGSGRTNGTRNGNRHHRAPASPAGIIRAAESERAPSSKDSSIEHDTAVVTAAVKMEGVLFSSSVVGGGGSSGRGEDAACPPANARNKRKGRALPSSAETGAGASLSGMRGGSSRRGGKRARQAVDDDVVVLAPDDPAVTAATGSTPREVTTKGSGARVTVKAER